MRNALWLVESEGLAINPNASLICVWMRSSSTVSWCLSACFASSSSLNLCCSFCCQSHFVNRCRMCWLLGRFIGSAGIAFGQVKWTWMILYCAGGSVHCSVQGRFLFSSRRCVLGPSVCFLLSLHHLCPYHWFRVS